MTPFEIIALALVKYGPAAARSLAALFYKKEITMADWEGVFSLAEKSYDSYTKPIQPPPPPA